MAAHFECWLGSIVPASRCSLEAHGFAASNTLKVTASGYRPSPPSTYSKPRGTTTPHEPQRYSRPAFQPHGSLTIADMTDEEFDLFADLTSGSPSLDDGEAAAIAIAANRKLLPIIDEKKGRTRASNLMAGQQPGWSLDLLRHPIVLHILEDAHANDALYLALRDGRMCVPAEFSEYAVVFV